MKFPISLVADFLKDEDYKILCEPTNAAETFHWVSTDKNLSETDCERTLFIGTVYQPRPLDCAAVLLCESNNWPKQNRAFVIANVSASPSFIEYSIQKYLLSIYSWIEDMHQALSRHCNCSELLSLSEPILKNYIGVSDSAFCYIAHTPGIEPIEDASRYLISHGMYSEETIRTVRQSGLAEKWTKSTPVRVFTENAINPMPSIEHVYHLNSQYAAHLVMVCKQPITAGQKFLFSLLIEPVATVLKGRWETDNPVAQRYSSFLSDLIHENKGATNVSREIAKSMDIPVNGLFKLCLVDESWKGGSASFFAARVMSLAPGCKAILEDEKLVILLHSSGTTRTSDLASTENRLFDMAEGLGTQVGVSRKFQSIFDISFAFAEACIALKYGKRHYQFFTVLLNDNPSSRESYTYRFKRYFPYLACDSHASDDISKRARKSALKLVDQMRLDDESTGAQDVTVLEAFLYSGGNIRAAASMLDMHRNSVAYRLSHIEKKYDLNLQSYDERIFLTVLLKLSRS